MTDKLFKDDSVDRERKSIIRRAALLHDVGHGPFSHVSESILNKYYSHETEKEKIHERITGYLIRENDQIKKIIGADEIEKTIGLLTGSKVDFSVIRTIISGPIDADKLDYLLRDSYFCGVKYGVFDLHRMLNTLTTHVEKYDRQIALEQGGIHSLEQFVLAKYYMTMQVYRHKIRTITDAMIIRAVELGIEHDEIPVLKKLYCYEESDEYFDNYINFWDEKLIYDILNPKWFSDFKGIYYIMT